MEELYTSQAAKLLGLSPSGVVRWEDAAGRL